MTAVPACHDSRPAYEDSDISSRVNGALRVGTTAMAIRSECFPSICRLWFH